MDKQEEGRNRYGFNIIVDEDGEMDLGSEITRDKKTGKYLVTLTFGGKDALTGKHCIDIYYGGLPVCGYLVNYR